MTLFQTINCLATKYHAFAIYKGIRANHGEGSETKQGQRLKMGVVGSIRIESFKSRRNSNAEEVCMSRNVKERGWVSAWIKVLFVLLR